MPGRPHTHGEEPEEPEISSRPHAAAGGHGSFRAHAETIGKVVAPAGRVKEPGDPVETLRPSPSATSDAVTQRSGTPGGVPEGHPTRIDPDEDAEVRRSLEMENSGAATLADQGWRVKQNPAPDEVAQARGAAGDTGRPEKNPDYLIEGRVFDCFSPTKPTKSARNIWSEVQEKVDDGQTQRAVINLEDWRGDIGALRRQFADWPMPGLKEVKAILPDGTVTQINLPEQS